MIALSGLPLGSRVAVAMSGGVDSSVAAALMVEAGYDVVGITLQLYDQGEVSSQSKTCCAGKDIYDARMVANTLKIPHYVLDYESVFKNNVIEDFVDGYLKGYTPLPCVRCNQRVKFRDLLTMARDLGAHALVTGHYVRRLMGDHGVELHRADETVRDQSYFLFATTLEQLSFLHFPLGDYPKHFVRDHARRLGLLVADKPDSQDICFVPDGNYAGVIQKLRPGAIESGKIVHQDGRILGEHNGVIHYTIGQRKGLGISSKEPLFVIELRPETHEVIVGPKSALEQTHILVSEVNWLIDAVCERTCHVKIRSSQEPLPAKLTPLSEQRAHVTLKNPEYGIAPGQACVFYEGSRVLGGGWIIPFEGSSINAWGGD